MGMTSIPEKHTRPWRVVAPTRCDCGRVAVYFDPPLCDECARALR